jgi:hypothetical protein
MNNNNISHRVVSNDSKLGIVPHARPCGRLPVTTKLNADESIQRGVNSLHEELTF